MVSQIVHDFLQRHSVGGHSQVDLLVESAKVQSIEVVDVIYATLSLRGVMLGNVLS